MSQAGILGLGSGGGGGSPGIQLKVQVFNSNGTYTPTSGMIYCTVEVAGGGGGGGGCDAQGATQTGAGAGGGAGGYARKTLSATTVGASQSVVVGTGGAGGAAGPNNGTAGNTSSFGAIASATGGAGGTGTFGGNGSASTGGVGGVGSGGDVNAAGMAGGDGYAAYFAAFGAPITMGGFGGTSYFGGGSLGPIDFGGAIPGNNGQPYGAGGSGAISGAGTAAAAGGNGSNGVVVVTEVIGTGGGSLVPAFGPVDIKTITDADSPYTIEDADQFILVDTTSGPVEILLPNPIVTTGRLLVIKDLGHASLNNIEVNPGAGITIENGTLLTMDVDLESIDIVNDGVNYWVW